jgi:hypothetical protein
MYQALVLDEMHFHPTYPQDHPQLLQSHQHKVVRLEHAFLTAMLPKFE